MNVDGEGNELFRELEKLGISPSMAKQLVAKHGHKRVKDIIQQTKTQKYANPAGYAIRALEQNWMVWSKSDMSGGSCDGLAYISGPFADFIKH